MHWVTNAYQKEFLNRNIQRNKSQFNLSKEDVIMAWINIVEPETATGKLKKIYELARKRAGDVPNITKLQSLRPETMNIGFALYRQIMDAPTGISRRLRVLIATVVSKVNGCYY